MPQEARELIDDVPNGEPEVPKASEVGQHLITADEVPQPLPHRPELPPSHTGPVVEGMPPQLGDIPERPILPPSHTGPVIEEMPPHLK